MLNKPLIPLYLRMSLLILGILAFFYILHVGQNILVPLVFALVIAILLNPAVNYMERRMHRVIAITIVVIAAAIIILGLLFFIGSQAFMLSNSFPLFNLRFNLILSDCVRWTAGAFDINPTQIELWISNAKNEWMNNTPAFIGQTLNTLSGVLIIIFLIPVYIFLFLFYKPLLLQFIAMLFLENNHETIVDILLETKKLIQKYLQGLLIEFVFISGLYTIALLLLGINYALLLGVIGGLLNLIPYIGRFIAVSLPIMLALVTKEPIFTFYIFGAYALIKFIDNNFINPMIVASRVKINALFSIVVVLIGGALWEIPGMFLSLPVTAIIKVVFDRITVLKPFGFLLGDSMPPIGKNIFFQQAKT